MSWARVTGTLRIGNHCFHAIGITDYMENGDDITIAQRMAGHANIKTTRFTTGATMG